jgi:hypothetical protein
MCSRGRSGGISRRTGASGAAGRIGRIGAWRGVSERSVAYQRVVGVSEHIAALCDVSGRLGTYRA